MHADVLVDARRTTIEVLAPDPITGSGLASQLQANFTIVSGGLADGRVDVTILAVDEVDGGVAQRVQRLAENGSRVLVVATRLDDAGVLAAIEAGACGLLRRHEATSDRLITAIRAAAAGEGTVPPDLLGRLLNQIGGLQRNVLTPRGLSVNGFAERELEVLRLVADGYDTKDIAHKLSYSERTVKNVIHDITNRLNLRNRSHAVSYAIRAGLI